MLAPLSKKAGSIYSTQISSSAFDPSLLDGAVGSSGAVPRNHWVIEPTKSTSNTECQAGKEWVPFLVF